jgi:hypothetical protein
MVSLAMRGGFWPSGAIAVADPYGLFRFDGIETGSGFLI